jgi:hypothetical protein
MGAGGGGVTRPPIAVKELLRYKLRFTWGWAEVLSIAHIVQILNWVALPKLFSLSLLFVCIEGRCLRSASSEQCLRLNTRTQNSAFVPQLIHISFKDDVNVIRLFDASFMTTARIYEAERNICERWRLCFTSVALMARRLGGWAESTISEARGRSQRWRSGTMDEGTIKTPIPKCRLYWCFCLGWCAIL